MTIFQLHREDPWEVLRRIPENVWAEFLHDLARQLMRSGKPPDAIGFVHAMSYEQLWQLADHLLTRCELQRDKIANLGQPTLEPASPIQALPPAIEYFDWRSHPWDDFTMSPNFAAIGAQGAGKTSVAKILCGLMSGFKIAIDPHQAPDTWGDLHKAGVNADYSAIAEMQLALIELVQFRYSQRRSDAQRFAPVTAIIDEMPAIALGRHGDTHKEFIKTMLTQARKVQVRCVFLTQTDRVDGFGLRSLGDLRDGLTMIRLKKHAIDYAAKLKDDDLLSVVRSCNPRPCMVDDKPAILPDLGMFPLRQGAAMPPDLAQVLGQVLGETDCDSGLSSDRAQSWSWGRLETSNNEQLMKLIEISRRCGWITASQAKQQSRLFQSMSPAEIRAMFAQLTEQGIGTLDGVDDGLKWRASNV